MEPTNYTGEERVRLANEQALRGDVGGALTKEGIISQDGTTPIKPVNTPITSDVLSSGSRAYTIPEVSTSSVADSIVAQTGAQAEMSALQREQQQKLTEAQTATNEARSGFRGAIDDIKNVFASRGKLEEDAKISEKAVASDEARIALETSQRAMTNELRALSGRGLTDVQKAAEQREITRKYAFEQADLSLTLDVAERRLDRAQKTIDRKIELQLEPLKYELEFNKSFYEENKDLLSKADQRLFDTKIRGLEKQFEIEKEVRTAVASIQLEALKNGVSIPSIVMKELEGAKSAQQVTEILLKNGISLENPTDKAYKLAQIAKTTAEATATGGGESNISSVTGKPLTDAERSARGYADRASTASQIISNIGSQFTSVFSRVGAMAPNEAKSPERQQFEQAQRDFINAVLRKESGAAISESEFENARKQYFPQPGDSPEVVTQKAQNRQTTINGLNLSGGREMSTDTVKTPEDYRTKYNY